MVSTVASLSPNRCTSGSRMRAKAGSPIQPSPSDATVMPSCVAERYSSRWCVSLRACRASCEPRRASSSRRVGLTLTSANSVATKKPLSRTRSTTAMRPRPMLIRKPPLTATDAASRAGVQGLAARTSFLIPRKSLRWLHIAAAAAVMVAVSQPGLQKVSTTAAGQLALGPRGISGQCSSQNEPLRVPLKPVDVAVPCDTSMPVFPACAPVPDVTSCTSK